MMLDFTAKNRFRVSLKEPYKLEVHCMMRVFEKKDVHDVFLCGKLAVHTRIDYSNCDIF